jgi:hypothetical protein
MGSDALVPSILAVLLLDSEGNRIIAKYYQGFQSCAVEQVCLRQHYILHSDVLRVNSRLNSLRKPKTLIQPEAMLM